MKLLQKLKNNGKELKTKELTKGNSEMLKHIIKARFQETSLVLFPLLHFLKIVQYYELGNDYFKKRSEIIDNLKVKNINDLAAKLFEKNDLFFMIVGKPDI